MINGMMNSNLALQFLNFFCRQDHEKIDQLSTDVGEIKFSLEYDYRYVCSIAQNVR